MPTAGSMEDIYSFNIKLTKYSNSEIERKKMEGKP